MLLQLSLVRLLLFRGSSWFNGGWVMLLLFGLLLELLEHLDKERGLLGGGVNSCFAGEVITGQALLVLEGCLW